MTREEFNIALDISLSKDRVKLCLEYINDLESRLCSNCYWSGNCETEKDIERYIDIRNPFGCTEFKRKIYED